MGAMKEFKTELGTELPLLNLRGKPYLQIAHRLVWLTEKYARYDVTTEFLKLEDDYSIARSVVTVFDDEGNIIRRASATKKETKSDFPDFVEKSETGSIGRALAIIGMGTQFCTQDLEEGNRLADSPIPPAKKKRTSSAAEKAKAKVSSFNKNRKEESTEGEDDGWE